MTDNLCAVCGGAMDRNRATCYQCGAEYHLALRTDVEMEDCGDTWIDEEMQALIFACNRCLGRVKPTEATSKRYTRREGTSARAVARGRRRAGRV